MSNYDRFPTVRVPYALHEGYARIAAVLQQALGGKADAVLVIDGYPGTRWDEIVGGLMGHLMFSNIIDAEQANLPNEHIAHMLQRNLTDDRVFGVLSCHKIEEFFDEKKLEVLRRRAEGGKGLMLVYGVAPRW